MQKQFDMWWMPFLVVLVSLLGAFYLIASRPATAFRGDEDMKHLVRITRFDVSRVTCYHNHYGLSCLKD